MEEVRPDWISWRCRKRLRRAHPRPLSSSPCVSTPSSVDLPASTLPRTARRRSMNCGQGQRIKPPFIYKWRTDVGHNRELGHPFSQRLRLSCDVKNCQQGINSNPPYPPPPQNNNEQQARKKYFPLSFLNTFKNKSVNSKQIVRGVLCVGFKKKYYSYAKSKYSHLRLGV